MTGCGHGFCDPRAGFARRERRPGYGWGRGFGFARGFRPYSKRFSKAVLQEKISFLEERLHELKQLQEELNEKEQDEN